MPIKIFLIVFAAGVVLLVLPRLVMGWQARVRVLPIESLPTEKVAIVFGAGLWRDGSPTPVLYDRVAAAAELYHAGKVIKLLMSGDNRFADYNEPAVMREVALSLGIPTEDIVLDYAGRRTYDTCYRARAIFGVKQAILVTQSFHLPRALFLCEHLGVDALGLAADLREYPASSRLTWNLRELIASAAAVWDVTIRRPLPVLGDPLPIFPEDP